MRSKLRSVANASCCGSSGVLGIVRHPRSVGAFSDVWEEAMKLIAIMLGVMLATVTGAVAGQGTSLTWHGHAAFEITTPSGKIILIDPWLNNPVESTGQR